MEQQILTISQINGYIQNLMDRDSLLAGIAVKGEISNYKVYPSGHHYFTLKDEGASLKCVMFRGQAMRLRIKPENGMKIIAIGKISVYPRDGAYQLYCNNITMDGVGDLYAAFEQMKAKLQAQGLFAPEHKKPIPQFPKVIGIVTSEAGAAIHDMLRILNKRYPLVKVRLLPVRVQGIEAPAEIAAAISYANKHRLADLLIVGRGGGSIEDLWAFNEEIVVRAIYDSEIPIISAVGHEPDVTIADFVADMRAATPSNAAELAVPDRNALQQNLDSMCVTMSTTLFQQIQGLKKQLSVLSSSSTLQSPLQYYQQKRTAFKYLQNRHIAAHRQVIAEKKHKFISLAAKLDAMSPLKVLGRGFSMAQTQDGAIVQSIKQVEIGQNLSVVVNDGVIAATITDKKERLL